MKKNLTILISILVAMSLCCSSLWYDCADAAKNIGEKCGVYSEDGYPVETLCEGKPGTSEGPWSETYIECTATGNTCSEIQSCTR
ncbi:MAG: hypothetical protein OEZ13_03625 [Spirochaetia bacterium]|nr:hypothetical protein [Spirochaetia bacterium]